MTSRFSCCTKPTSTTPRTTVPGRAQGRPTAEVRRPGRGAPLVADDTLKRGWSVGEPASYRGDHLFGLHAYLGKGGALDVHHRHPSPHVVGPTEMLVLLRLDLLARRLKTRS